MHILVQYSKKFICNMQYLFDVASLVGAVYDKVSDGLNLATYT